MVIVVLENLFDNATFFLSLLLTVSEVHNIFLDHVVHDSVLLLKMMRLQDHFTLGIARTVNLHVLVEFLLFLVQVVHVVYIRQRLRLSFQLLDLL